MAKAAKAPMSDAEQDWKYKVEDAARVLMRSQEVYADAKLLKAARAELVRQRIAINKAIGKSPGAAVKGK